MTSLSSIHRLIFDVKKDIPLNTFKVPEDYEIEEYMDEDELQEKIEWVVDEIEKQKQYRENCLDNIEICRQFYLKRREEIGEDIKMLQELYNKLKMALDYLNY